MGLLLLLSLALSVGGFFARRVLLQTGIDAKGLLISGNPMRPVYWGLAAAAALLSILWSLKKPEGSIPAPSGVPAGIFQIAAALGILAAAFTGGQDSTFLKVLGIAVALIYMGEGAARLLKKPVTVLGSSALCVYFCVYTVTSYQLWRSNPQAELFLAPALGIFLMLLLSCELAAWEIGKQSVRVLTVESVLAVYFCVSSLGEPGMLCLYGAGALLGLESLFFLGEGRKNL